MLGTTHLAGFIVSGFLLNLYPGQDTMYIIGRSMSQGRRAGILSVLGISTGCLVHTLFASFGLYSVLAASKEAFFLVRLAGALYLMYLGLRVFFSKVGDANAETYLAGQSDFLIYRQGLLTNLLNPKVALFFLSFLPQFVDPVHNYGPLTFIFLGSIFFCTGTLWCLAVAVFASALSGTLGRHTLITGALEKVTGIVFVAIGVTLLINRP